MSGKILVIAEQQRLQRLFVGMAEAQARGVSVVAGLVDAADQIAQGVPELILVQDRLSGLSAELIIRHLRSRLQDAATMIVLASEAADALDISAADLHLLDSTQPDQELVRQLERLVARLPKLEPVEPAPPAVAIDEFVPDPRLQPEMVVAPAPVPTSSAAPAPMLEPAAEDSSTEQTVAVPADNDQAPRVPSRFDAELETELARLEPLAGGEPVPDATPALSVAELLTVTETAAGHPAAGVGRWLGLGAVVVLLVAASWFGIRSLSSPPPSAKVKGAAVKPLPVVAPQSSAAKPHPPAPVAAPPATPSPAPPRFVAAARALLDPAYGRDHAGWERYLTQAVEFKLYREGGRLKAVQVLDRAGAGLSPKLFSTAMDELAGVRDYQSEGREIKGNYLVKKGRLADNSKILIYKDRQDTALHGFVIYFN